MADEQELVHFAAVLKCNVKGLLTVCHNSVEMEGRLFVYNSS